MKFVRWVVASILAIGSSSFGAYVTDFESPPFFSGPINGQDGWTTPSAVEFTSRIQTASEIEAQLINAGLTPGLTVHSGTQALFVSGSGGSSATIRQIGGLETERLVRLELWARPLGAGTTGAPLGNIFVTMEDISGERAAAFRFGLVNGVQTIDYGTNVGGVWLPTGLTWDQETWYRLTLVVDYFLKTYDISIDGVKVNADPIPFYNPLSDDFRQVRIFRGSNQAGMLADDLTIDNIPEPAIGGAMFIGLIALASRRRRSEVA